MTTEQNKPENNVVDELISQWFDSEQAESFELIRKSLDTKQAHRIAELQLVHSLLLQLADKDEVAKERRIQKVMQQINTHTEIARKFYHIARPLIRYGIAAVIIISFAILFTQLPTNTASASIDKMIAAIDSAGDRTYSFIVIDSEKNNRRTQPPQNPEKAKGTGERARTRWGNSLSSRQRQVRPLPPDNFRQNAYNRQRRPNKMDDST